MLTENTPSLLERVQRDLIGNRCALQTPYGERPLIYADYTASGRALGFLEDNIREQVLPYYANTHTEASLTGAQSNALREAARNAVHASVNGNAQDKVIFCGAGATAAIDKLVGILGIRIPRELDERYDLEAALPRSERPVIFVGPYEHHSNELPWRETIADVIRIGLDSNGAIDQSQLSAELETYKHRPLRIGSFSAASNVTGVRSDVSGITRRLKNAGALAFWDYAAAGPYVAIDMNPDDTSIDAIFVSPHKFIGGPGTPGVLVAKRHLFKNAVPAVVGGGTVSYVSPTEHRYIEDPVHREEGGTPAIVESIRAGLVFALKDQIGADVIEAREEALVVKALEKFAEVPNIDVLGPTNQARLGIFSLRFRHADKELHHGFVAALLNDLFGIQARGGCSCAGPYGHDLLHIDTAASAALDSVVSEGYECFKPGWVRVNLHYVASDEEVNYLLSALELVARYGWRLLPAYQLNPLTGLWRHRAGTPSLPVDFPALLDPDHAPSTSRCALALNDLLTEAEEILLQGASTSHCCDARAESPLPPHIDKHRWFSTVADTDASPSDNAPLQSAPSQDTGAFPQTDALQGSLRRPVEHSVC